MSTSTLTISQLQALATGIPKYCATMTFMLAGQSYNATQVVQLVTGLLAAANATVVAKAAAKESTVAEDALFATDGKVIQDLRQSLVLAFKDSPTTLADLQVSARKPAKPLTAEALTAKVVKARATRVARGTTSKQQKAKITGNVTGVSISPVVAGGASPVAAVAPAAAPSVTTAASAIGPTSAVAGTGGGTHGA